ncbi:GILT-like protein 1 [Zeugodacus cucurbitae]|uniref:Gamma-interferon-inducible lysosomal thiol reductase n=1 Tax=Zeugodacus cucurbitae TaxID=28588 RepID=A0A0A1WYZ3_ZEUCU|nr:GILT-like protein 1 [Zeugodacus cucurbitae]
MLEIEIKWSVFVLLQFVFVVLTGAQGGQSVAPNKLDVTILYESLCPDSIRFMGRQLAPAYGNLKENLNINLVPFGKSRSVNLGSEFYCQHGPAECAGNRLQSCVLNQESTQNQRVRFAICQMLAKDKQNVEDCTDLVGLSSDVDDCVNTNVGTQLQLLAEQVTNQYTPSFVPTIIYDGVFNQQLQDASLYDFRGTVCALLQKRGIVNESCSA